jgi:hypothetical protein
MFNRPHLIDGNRVVSKRAVSRREPNVSSKFLFVSGIREHHTENHLLDYFAKFGNVIKVRFRQVLSISLLD